MSDSTNPDDSIDSKPTEIESKSMTDERKAFNEAVVSELKSRGRFNVAEMSADYDRDMSSLSSADVADEMDLPVDSEDENAVSAVADDREFWYDEMF